MLFTYWTSENLSEPPSTKVWREEYPHYTVFGDDAVLPLLGSEELRDMYRRIALPAAKSDIARLLLLREHGGLYMDAHTGPADGARLAQTLETLSAYELLLFRAPGDGSSSHLTNAVIGARRHAPLLDLAINLALSNLMKQKQREEEKQDYVPYSLFGLTGTEVLLSCYYSRVTKPAVIKQEYENRIFAHWMTSHSSLGFHIYSHYGYREPGKHWSELQKHKCLFIRS